MLIVRFEIGPSPYPTIERKARTGTLSREFLLFPFSNYKPMTPFLNNPTEPTEASRILIVEDEAIVAESLKDQLINLGYQVCGTAANGEDAMRIMEHSEPDLVMMDIMLEGPMDGVEVAGRICEKTRFR